MIKGEQVTLRPITKEDTELVLSWRNAEQVKQYFIYREDITPQEHLAWLENKVKTGKVAQFIIETENGPVGSVYLQSIDHTHKNAEYGIFIGAADCLGKGYGTAAGRLILEYAFEVLHLHKVYLRVIDNNKRAIKSYESMGFAVEGVLKDEIYVDGRYYDIIRMSILEGQIKK